MILVKNKWKILKVRVISNYVFIYFFVIWCKEYLVLGFSDFLGI